MKKPLLVVITILFAMTVVQFNTNAVSDLPDEVAAQEPTAQDQPEQEQADETASSGFRIKDVLPERSGEGGNYLYGLETDIWGKKGNETTERVRQYEKEQDQALWDSLYSDDYKGPPSVSYSEVMADESMSYVFEEPELHLRTNVEEQNSFLNIVLLLLLFFMLAITTYYATLGIRKMIKRKKKA